MHACCEALAVMTRADILSEHNVRWDVDGLLALAQRHARREAQGEAGEAHRDTGLLLAMLREALELCQP